MFRKKVQIKQVCAVTPHTTSAIHCPACYIRITCLTAVVSAWPCGPLAPANCWPTGGQPPTLALPPAGTYTRSLCTGPQFALPPCCVAVAPHCDLGPLAACLPVSSPICRPQSPPTVIWDHARYRYLLNLDGYAASSRLGALMAVDSPLIKSRWVSVNTHSVRAT